VRAELRGLSQLTAQRVGAHLLLAGQLVDTDPRQAYEHALAARGQAARLPVVREAVAETAYAAEEYGTALAEYRTLHRMTGSADYLPVMANCERALGRPDAALRLLQSATRDDMSAQQYVEALLETAGARSDLGQVAEALRVLRGAIAGRVGHRGGQARLRYAYADFLERQGDLDQARDWFASAAALDPDDELEVLARLDRLDGIVLEFDDLDDDLSDDEPSPHQESDD